MQWTSSQRGQKTQVPFTGRFVLGENKYLFSILLGSFKRIGEFSISLKCFDFPVKAAVCQLAKYSHFFQVFFSQERGKLLGFLEFRTGFVVPFIAVFSLGENGEWEWGQQPHEQPEDGGSASL